MKTEQIILALTVAREKSISKAAEALFLSQPTASNMLKALENELGWEIFERGRNGISLTPEGRDFIEQAGYIKRSLDGIARIGKDARYIDLCIFSIHADFSERAFEKLCENTAPSPVPSTLAFSSSAVSRTRPDCCPPGRATRLL